MRKGMNIAVWVIAGAVGSSIGMKAGAQSWTGAAPPAPPATPAVAPLDRTLAYMPGDGVPVVALGRETSVTTIRSDNRTIKVEQRDGRIEVIVDGERVYEGSADEDWKTKEISSADGGVVARLVRYADEGLSQLIVRRSHAGQGGEWAARAGAGSPSFYSAYRVEADAPKVMLGVSMETPSEALAAQLGLDASGSTVLTNVMEGLPASKAGLKKFDVLVSLDGSAGAAPSRIRELLREKEPGDELVVTLVRGGDRSDATIVLEAYDATRIGAPGVEVVGWLSSDMLQPRMNELREQLAEVVREQEDLAQQLATMGAEEAAKLREEMMKLRERASALRSEISEQSSRFFRTPAAPLPPIAIAPGMSDGSGEGARVRAWVYGESGERMEEQIRMIQERTQRQIEEMMSRVGGAMGRDAATDARFESLQSKIDRLEATIERLVERLENEEKASSKAGD